MLTDVEYESWGGYDDPRLPERIWKGKIAVTGDASGGLISSFVRFSLAGAPRLDNFYSLEECWLRKAGSAEVPLLDIRNFGSTKTGIKFNTLRLQLFAGDNGILGQDTNRLVPSMFLGQQVVTSTPSEIVVQVDNVNGVVFDVWMGGYAWGPRSASAKNGGLQRPIGGIFA